MRDWMSNCTARLKEDVMTFPCPNLNVGLGVPWWRHQMETFSALLAICAGNSPATSEFPAQRPGTRSFDVFFDLYLNKRLSKQWRGWWFETPSCPLWRHCVLYQDYVISHRILRNAYLNKNLPQSPPLTWRSSAVLWIFNLQTSCSEAYEIYRTSVLWS